MKTIATAMKKETLPSNFKSGRVEYRIESGQVYGKEAFFPILVRGYTIKGPFCLISGTGGHIVGVPTYEAAMDIISNDCAGKNLREILTTN